MTTPIPPRIAALVDQTTVAAPASAPSAAGSIEEGSKQQRNQSNIGRADGHAAPRLRQVTTVWPSAAASVKAAQTSHQPCSSREESAMRMIHCAAAASAIGSW